MEKAKKGKKFKAVYASITCIAPEKRDLILKYYYDYYVCFTNIKAAIHWCAIDQCNKGLRDVEENFTDEEFRNL